MATEPKKCWIPLNDVIFIIKPSLLQGYNGRHYELTITDYDQIQAVVAA